MTLSLDGRSKIGIILRHHRHRFKNRKARKNYKIKNKSGECTQKVHVASDSWYQNQTGSE